MKKLLMILAAAAFIAGCATKTPVPETKVDDKSQTPPPTQNVAPPPSTGQTGGQGVVGKPDVRAQLKSGMLAQRSIYFDYDKDSVKPEFAALVQAHAKFLSENKEFKIRLEGNADERGSREYNMALGQRRAEAVKKALSVLGVADNRMETISFGEDKPKATGHDEAAWAQNRRVDIVYSGE